MGAKDMSHLPIAGAAAATAALHATSALKKDCQQNQMPASTFLKKFLHDLSLLEKFLHFEVILLRPLPPVPFLSVLLLAFAFYRFLRRT